MVVFEVSSFYYAWHWDLYYPWWLLPGCFWLAAKLQLTSRQMHDLKDELLLAPYLDLLFSFVLAWFLGNHCKPYCITVKETRNKRSGGETSHASLCSSSSPWRGRHRLSYNVFTLPSCVSSNFCRKSPSSSSTSEAVYVEEIVGESFSAYGLFSFSCVFIQYTAFVM